MSVLGLCREETLHVFHTWTTNSNQLICIKDWSSEFCKTKTKVTAMTNHNRKKKRHEPARIGSNYMYHTFTKSYKTLKHARASRDLLWFYFSFAEKVARVLSNTVTNHRAA